MTSHNPPPTASGRPAAGEFPQPVSPWESRGLLFAEVVGALAVLALVLANSMDPGFWQVPDGAAQATAQAAPVATSLSTVETSE